MKKQLTSHAKKMLNYTTQNGFISPGFQNTGLSLPEFWEALDELLKLNLIKRRNCIGIAYEMAGKTQ